MKRLIEAVCCLAAVMVTASARADLGFEDGNAATGDIQPLAQVENTFRPSGLAEVEMQTELLDIHLHIEGAEVEIDYTLHNPGDKPVTVTAGFPTLSQLVVLGEDPSVTLAHRKPYDVTDYHLVVDGKETTWKLEPQPPPVKWESGNGQPGMTSTKTPYSTPEPFWFVSSIPFDAGQTHAVHIRYWAQYRNSDVGEEGDSYVAPVTFGYQLSTAAGWKGPISKGRVIITADSVDAGAIKILPKGRFQRGGKTFEWDFSDLKPTQADDISVQVRDGYHEFAAVLATGKDRPKDNGEDGSIAAAGYYQVHSDGVSYWKSQAFHATATSSLDPQKYAAENVGEHGSFPYLGNPWAEGVPGDGIGEGLDLTLDWPSKVCEIGILNGYHDCGFNNLNNSRKLYQENDRVAELGVSINGGKEVVVPVPDEFLQSRNFEPYWFPVDCHDELVKTIRLRIRKVYHGTKYQDTCISQIYIKTKLARTPKRDPNRL